MMKKIILILITGILISAQLPLHTMDSSSFIIRLSGFSEKIFSQEISRYTLTSSDKNFSLLENCYQKIVKEEMSGGKKTIEVKTGNMGNNCAVRPESGLLNNTRFLNLDSEDIKKEAAKFKDSRDPARDIESFVFGHISKKIIGIPIIPAVQILENRTGDCTEHAILTISLLRSLGIPARGVVGVYLADNFEGNRNVFVFHMWAEAYMGGRWQIMDSTRPGKKSYNRYIAFAYHSLKTEMPLSFLKAMSAIRDMEIRYVAD